MDVHRGFGSWRRSGCGRSGRSGFRGLLRLVVVVGFARSLTVTIMVVVVANVRTLHTIF